VDPLTAGFNAVVAVCELVGKIIDTVPTAQHEANWARMEKGLRALDNLSERIRSLNIDE